MTEPISPELYSDRMVSPPLEELSDLRPKLTKGEHTVLKLFLEHLDPEWEIYIQPYLNGLRPDFALLKPTVGVAVFEVKDWDLSSDFYKHRRSPFKNPIDKVALYRDEISNLYCPRIQSNNAYACVTSGVIFTEATLKEVDSFCHTLKGYDANSQYNKYMPISNAEDLNSGNINSIFPEHCRSSSRYMNVEVAKDFRNWVHEPDFSVEQRRPLQFNSQQKTVATSRTASGYRRVKGPAGSGKSLVLAARAANLLAEGKDVLVISYNITLLNYLKDLAVRSKMANTPRHGITWYNFHNWCKRTCYITGNKDRYHAIWAHEQSFATNQEDSQYAGISNDHNLEHELPNLTEQCINQNKTLVDTYNAILVDEGQDLNPRWWNLLRMVLRDNGEMLLVSDTTQDIYKKSSYWTDHAMKNCGFIGPWTELKGSYRIPAALRPLLIKFAHLFLPKATLIEPDKPDQTTFFEHVEGPCKLRWVQTTDEKAVDICFNEIIRLSPSAESEPLPIADITFLAGDRDICIPVIKGLNDKKIKVSHTFHKERGKAERRLKLLFYRGAGHVKVTTVHSYKGMENRAIVIHISKNDTSPSLAYTGLSRLKRSEVAESGSYLTVICTDPKYLDYAKEWPEFEVK